MIAIAKASDTEREVLFGNAADRAGMPDTERYFSSAEDLMNEYQIDGKPVKEWAESIRIEDYTGFDA